MPAPPLQNTFESGQPDGTAITSGNSGGGAGDAFQATGGTAPNFSTTQAYTGTLSAAIAGVTAANGQSTANWTGLGASGGTNVFVRQYLYYTAFSTSGSVTCSCVRATGGTGCAFAIISGGGQVNFMNAAQSVIAALNGSSVAPLNQWFRLEYRVTPSTTVGEIEWRLYSTPDSTTITETKSAGGLVLGADIDAARWGMDRTVSVTFTTYQVDDVAVSTGGWIGVNDIAPRRTVPSEFSARHFGPF